VLAASLCVAACVPTVLQRPDNSTAYANFLVGRVANLNQDHQAASDRYFEALVRSPHDEVLIDGAMTAALASGDFNRASQVARMAPATGGPAFVHIVRAIDALNATRFAQAREESDRAEGSAGEELMARMLLTWARTGEGHVDDVTLELERLSSVRPYGALFAYQQAMALDFAGRQPEALQAYATADEGGLWLPAGIERHADLLARTGARADAIALLNGERAAQTNPALAAALARLQGGAAAAAQPLTPAKGAAVGLYGLAAIYMQESDVSNGLAALTLSLALDPSFDAARVAFAEAQGQLGHHVEARAALERVSASSPYSETARVMEAWVLVDEGRPEDALSLAQRTAEAGGVRSKRALADIYRRLDRPADADPLYTELIAASPDDWRLYFSRGAGRQQLNRWPEAEADMRHALQLSPDQADVLNYLGYSWIDRGEHLQEGLAMIQRAVAIRPLSGAIIDSLGWAYFRMGRFEEALEPLEHAVELEPSDAILNDHLGDEYWRLGRRIEARFQWNRALSLAPEEPALIQQKIDHGLPPSPAARAAHR
jgi:tetratricopeptide (TPR) repeat protein